MNSVIPTLRIILDVNVWVANLMAASRGRQGTTIQQIIAMVANGKLESRNVQLVVSHEMLRTLETVLLRKGTSASNTATYLDVIRDIMRFGPDELDPYLVVGDGREQFAMKDAEDAGILATAVASRASLLVTDNLKDFETKDAQQVDTRIIRSSSRSRQLKALRHRRPDADIVVAHPLDVIDWMKQGCPLDPDAIWNHIANEASLRLRR